MYVAHAYTYARIHIMHIYTYEHTYMHICVHVHIIHTHIHTELEFISQESKYTPPLLAPRPVELG